MESGLKSVSKLFTEQLFRIPDYQRGFSWTNKQLSDFWSDLELLLVTQKHYIGVLTLETIPEKTWSKWSNDKWLVVSKNFSPNYVVDGQQRLTSIIILIQCIVEKLKSDEVLNYDNKEAIQSKYIHLSKDGNEGSFLFGYERDNPSYEYLKTKILNKSSSRYSAGETTIYTKNLLAAKEFFTAKLKPATLAQLSTLYAKVTQQLLFNVFNIEKEVDVHVAFETMNNRGLQLSNLELLKNRLIYLSTRLAEPLGNTESVRTTINNSWRTVYYFLGKNQKASLNDDYFLQIHFILYFGKKVMDSNPKLVTNTFTSLSHDGFYKKFLLDEEFTIRRIYSTNSKERLSSTEMYQYSMDLKRVVENYYHICFPADSTFSPEEKIWYERLRRLIAAFDTREIFVVLLQFIPQISDQVQRVSFLEKIEQYFFLTQLLPYSFRKKNNPLNIAHEIITLIGKKATPENLKNKLEDEINSLKQISGFSDAILEGMSNSGYYGWRDLKYFIYEYERELKIKAKRKTDKINWDTFIGDEEIEDQSSIEHILPQTPTDPYWKNVLQGYSAREVKKLTNSLGNLVGTSASRNSSLRNLSFPEKIGMTGKKTGYKFGSYSEIEVSLYKEWGPAQILERGLILLDFIEKRWNVNLGSVAEKKKCLGLDFMS